MPAATTPPWASWHRSGANLRLSDAERSAMADTLSRHFADGRLDEAEFAERLDRTMAAKVRSDFTGLLDDLPPLPGSAAATAAPGPAARRGRPRRLAGLVLLAVALVMLTATWPVAHLYAAFGLVRLALVALLVTAIWRRRGHRHHRHGRPGWAERDDRLVG